VTTTFRLVDEQWTPIGEFTTDRAEWLVGDEFFLDDGRGFAIVAIVPVADLDVGDAGTWMVEPI
jgi:hypothetical protein